jgi:hypothetical protein
MTEQIGQGLRRHDLVLLLPIAQEAVVKEDVGVENLARFRIDPRGPDGEAGLGSNPAEEVVIDVFRVDLIFPLFVVTRLVDVDRVVISELLEGLVPFENPLRHPGTQVLGNRLFDVEHDRLDRRGDGAFRRFFLEVPAVDVPHKVLVVFLVGEVLPHGKEVAHPVVGLTRLIVGGGQTADPVVHLDLDAAGIDHRLKVLHSAIDGRDAELGVVLEDLDLGPRRAIGDEMERRSRRADRTPDHLVIVHKRAGEIDNVAAFGVGHNGERVEHAVAIGHRNRVGLGSSRISQEADVAAHHVQIVADLLEDPDDVVVETEVHAADNVITADALGDRSEDDEFLIEVARLDEDQEPLVVVPHLEEAVFSGRLHSVGDQLELRLGMLARARALRCRQGCQRGSALGKGRRAERKTKGQHKRRNEKSACRFHKVTPTKLGLSAGGPDRAS